MKQAGRAMLALAIEEAAPKASDPPVMDSGPQKQETSKPEKKEIWIVKTQNKVQDKLEEELPLLIPIGETLAKENVEISPGWCDSVD